MPVALTVKVAESPPMTVTLSGSATMTVISTVEGERGGERGRGERERKRERERERERGKGEREKSRGKSDINDLVQW